MLDVITLSVIQLALEPGSRAAAAIEYVVLKLGVTVEIQVA
jgi:hypothetical protein